MLPRNGVQLIIQSRNISTRASVLGFVAGWGCIRNFDLSTLRVRRATTDVSWNTRAASAIRGLMMFVVMSFCMLRRRVALRHTY